MRGFKPKRTYHINSDALPIELGRTKYGGGGGGEYSKSLCTYQGDASISRECMVGT